jgi:hypothetical protein
LTDEETNRATVARLTTILKGELPIHVGSEIIAPGVVAHVDGWRFEGINVWANWIHYLRTRGRVADPTLLVDELSVRPDAKVTIRGRWQGTRDGRVATSKPGMATYRLENGRIVEIWSTRTNYAFLCGAHVEYHLGLAYELLRTQWWQTRVPRLDLLASTQTHTMTLSTRTVATAVFARD